jgi:hypothetical protein
VQPRNHVQPGRAGAIVVAPPALAAGDLGDSDSELVSPPATDATEAALGHKTISFFGV